MSSYPKRSRGERGAIDQDEPPFSRLFVSCGKSSTADDVRERFKEFGTIEDLWLVLDKRSQRSKGVAFVKFRKMSEACLAVEGLNGKYLKEGDEKFMKVFVAQPKSAEIMDDLEFEKALTRVFCSTPQGMGSNDMKEYFSQYGEVEYVDIVKNKKTGESKGCAFVKFLRPYHAALAVESAEVQYRAIIAEPRGMKKKKQDDFDSSHRDSMPVRDMAPPIHEPYIHEPYIHGPPGPSRALARNMPFRAVDERVPSDVSTKLVVHAHRSVDRIRLEKLLNLVPGLEFFDLKEDPFTGSSLGIAHVEYGSIGEAVYAKEKLHGFEYPFGEPLAVSFFHSAESDMRPVEPSSMSMARPNIMPRGGPRFVSDEYKETFTDVDTGLQCTAKLPPKKPLANENATTAMRLFIVCHGKLPMSDRQLTDVFSKFGDLIETYFTKENVAFARYASRESAKEAMRVVHGCDLEGVRIKVMEASLEKPVTNRRAQKRRRGGY